MHHSGSIGGLGRTSLGALGVPMNYSVAPVAPPVEWESTWGVAEYRPSPTLIRHADGAVATLDKSPSEIFDLFSPARSAPANTYHVAPAGNDISGTGAETSPFRSIWKAVAAANASEQPARIEVQAGEYGKPYNPSQFNALRPAVDIAFIAKGGRVVVGSWDDFAAPAKDATFANCHSYTLTNVGRVIDRSRLDRDGFHPDLLHVADAATCNRIAGSWTLESGKIYINRHDGKAVTNANTRVLRRNGAIWRFHQPVSVYIGPGDTISGFDCQGSSAAAGFHYQTTTMPMSMKAVVVEKATFKYGADDEAAGSNGVLLHGLHGIALFSDCDASNNRKDGFGLSGGMASARGHMLTLNCRAVRCGGGTATSCNALTAHDNGIIADFAGVYGKTMGGAVRMVQDARAWLLGTRIVDDFGDIALGGDTSAAAIMANDQSWVWAERAHLSIPPAQAQVYVSADAELALRHMAPLRSPAAGTGMVNEW